jgi:hypothetical protein
MAKSLAKLEQLLKTCIPDHIALFLNDIGFGQLFRWSCQSGGERNYSSQDL